MLLNSDIGYLSFYKFYDYISLLLKLRANRKLCALFLNYFALIWRRNAKPYINEHYRYNPLLLIRR